MVSFTTSESGSASGKRFLDFIGFGKGKRFEFEIFHKLKPKGKKQISNNQKTGKNSANGSQPASDTFDEIEQRSLSGQAGDTGEGGQALKETSFNECTSQDEAPSGHGQKTKLWTRAKSLIIAKWHRPEQQNPSKDADAEGTRSDTTPSKSTLFRILARSFSQLFGILRRSVFMLRKFLPLICPAITIATIILGACLLHNHERTEEQCNAVLSGATIIFPSISSAFDGIINWRPHPEVFKIVKSIACILGICLFVAGLCISLCVTNPVVLSYLGDLLFLLSTMMFGLASRPNKSDEVASCRQGNREASTAKGPASSSNQKSATEAEAVVMLASGDAEQKLSEIIAPFTRLSILSTGSSPASSS